MHEIDEPERQADTTEAMPSGDAASAPQIPTLPHLPDPSPRRGRWRISRILAGLFGIALIIAPIAIRLVQPSLRFYYSQQNNRTIDTFMTAARNPDRVVLEWYCRDDVNHRTYLPDVELTEPKHLRKFAEFMRAAEAKPLDIQAELSKSIEERRNEPLPPKPDGITINRLTMHIYANGREYCADMSTRNWLEMDDAGFTALKGFSTTELFEWLRDAGLLEGADE